MEIECLERLRLVHQHATAPMSHPIYEKEGCQKPFRSTPSSGIYVIAHCGSVIHKP